MRDLRNTRVRAESRLQLWRDGSPALLDIKSISIKMFGNGNVLVSEDGIVSVKDASSFRNAWNDVVEAATRIVEAEKDLYIADRPELVDAFVQLGGEWIAFSPSARARHDPVKASEELMGVVQERTDAIE